MTQVFCLPDLGEGLTEAEVVSWHVRVGEDVRVDQEVVTVETAKASVDVPCPFAGSVAELHAEPGTVLQVGAPLITIDGAGDAAPAGERYRSEERAGTRVPERPLVGYGAGDAAQRRRHRRHPRLPRPSVADGRSGPRPSVANGRQDWAVRVISPLVRQLARSYGIDLRDVIPGPTGVIRRVDLEAHRSRARTEQLRATLGGGLEQPRATLGGEGEQPRATLGGEGEVRLPIRGAHRVLVDRLSISRREIPDATTWVDVDATRLLRIRDALRAARPDAGIGVLALLARITVAGLTAYPAVNSSVDLAAGEIVQHGTINLGFAAQSPRGLVVPVVHGAGAMTTTELAAALRELTGKARDGTLSSSELTGGTFTLNNYGVFGVDGSTPIINHPEAAMLGVGRIIDKPWVRRGKLRVRKVAQLSFTFDHRVCDGGTAGGFLRLVADCVEEPAALLCEV